MTPKEQFDACTKLAELAAGRHNSRRDFEWKISLGLWAALLASSTVIKLPLPLWAPFAITIPYVILWLFPLWAANDADKRRYNHFYSEAAKTVTQGVHSIGDDPQRLKGLMAVSSYLKDWAMWFHTVVTFAISILIVAYSRGYVG